MKTPIFLLLAHDNFCFLSTDQEKQKSGIMTDYCYCKRIEACTKSSEKKRVTVDLTESRHED